jgi:iron(III) transport system ATP-binding protein
VPNRLEAEIREIEFLGSFCRATLTLSALPGAELVAEFSINLMRDYALAAGRRLTVALPPSRLSIFAKAGG